ncbi:DUF2975 domain-containing protein [Pediococcus siamensis]|uniref:DUF2975 domain-containing protein n=1 Tax=Pediococcus siamensis TaxID=381829 RepID=UPI0039A1011A
MKFRQLFLNLALLAIALLLWLVGFLYLIQVLTGPKLQHPVVIACLGVTVLGTVILGTQIMYFLHRMLTLIANHQAFSTTSIVLVKKIRRDIGIVSLCFIFAMPFFFTVAQLDDAPGVVLLGFATVCAPFAVYILSQIIEDLFTSALNLQKDHDLTI